MLTEITTKNPVMKVPFGKLTIMYSGDGMSNLRVANIKTHEFHMDREDILKNFLMLSDEKRKRACMLTTAIIGGMSALSFDENTKKFNDGVPATINSLSSGVAQCLGVCTILDNSELFSEKDKETGIYQIYHPEANLHPSSQSALGKMLVDLACSKTNKTQIIIDTWSDHIINGIRVALLEKDKNSNEKHYGDIVINFFKNKTVTSILIGNKSALSYYPDGFMDQWSKDISALLRF